MLKIEYRPLEDLTWCRPEAKRTWSQFSASWTKTLELLETEIGHLKGSDVTIRLGCTWDEIRADGTGVKGNRRIHNPAVQIDFESKIHGPLVYPADGLRTTGSREAWRDNVRALALIMEMQRAMDRYGGVQDRQYTAFKALPAGSGAASSSMTYEDAVEIVKQVLASVGKVGLMNGSQWGVVFRAARAVTHPDVNGGKRGQYDLVNEAIAVIERKHRL